MRLLLPLAALWIAMPTSAQGLKEFRDWVGACDNTRHCTAIGLAPDGAETDASLHLERGGAGIAAVERITLRVDQPLAEGASWRLVDERDQTLLRLETRHLGLSDGEDRRAVVFEREDEIATLLGALRTAASLGLVGDSGTAGTVSLSGASAVLLWIDEQQQRLGTTTAFVRRGDRDPATIPAPPAAPRAPLAVAAGVVLGEQDARALAESLRDADGAEDCEAPEGGFVLNDEAWQLTEGRTLLQRICFVGAYNVGTRFYLIDTAGGVEPVSFPTPGESGRLIREAELVNAGFDPDRGRLSSFGKGRGLGDCGSAGEWAWTGSAFVLVSYTRLPLCRGVPPEDWPVLWRSAD